METEYCSVCNLLFKHKERESSDFEWFGDDKESCDGYYFHLIQSWKYKGVVCFDDVRTSEIISYNYDYNVSYESEEVP